jgi:hypothetical protein
MEGAGTEGWGGEEVRGWGDEGMKEAATLFCNLKYLQSEI